MQKKTVSLFIFTVVIAAVLSQSYANMTASQSEIVVFEKPFRNSNINITQRAVPFDSALIALVKPIESVSLYADCNRYPEKYDLYDGKLMLDNEPCFSNTCIEERETIYGISMEPTIHNRQTVYVRIRDSDFNLSIGRIIMYYDGLNQNEQYEYVIHRIVGIENNAVKIERAGNNYFVRTNDVLNTTYSWQAKRFMEKLERPYFVVRGDNNDGCEIVPRNMIYGVLTGIG